MEGSDHDDGNTDEDNKSLLSIFLNYQAPC